MTTSRREPLGGSAAGRRDRWLLSYADFITLLLALFVVLYASAKLDADRSKLLFEGLEAAFFFEERSPSPIPLDVDPAQAADRADRGEVDSESRLRESLEQALESRRWPAGESLGASVHGSERGVVVSLASTEFFPEGGVEISELRESVLAALAPLLAAHDAPVHVEGHTDDRPIRSERHPSNWELSAARAAAVARYFIEEHGIDPARFAATGYAEFHPIASNGSAAGRARNRRVDIVLLRDAGEAPEPVRGKSDDEALQRLLDGLPPLPVEADESLRADEPGPPPQSIPLP